jgi:hypothetical protein
MGRTSSWLLDYRSNVHSQTGEDGILGKVVGMLPQTDRWCVEFGAWDGEYLSNVCHLVDAHGYSAVLIEASSRKFEDLLRRHSKNPKVVAINRTVGFQDHDGLDAILADTAIPVDFDVLSIDIDGNDYHVWNQVSRYRPKVVCIEFNPTIPNEVRFVQPADPTVAQGASLSALADLGRSKGYELVCVLTFNAIFVRSEYFPLFEIEDNRPEVLRADLDLITYFFTGYDGTVFLRGAAWLPWHDLPLEESRLQALPRRLRGYPLDYSPFQRVLFRLWRSVRRW